MIGTLLMFQGGMTAGLTVAFGLLASTLLLAGNTLRGRL